MEPLVITDITENEQPTCIAFAGCTRIGAGSVQDLAVAARESPETDHVCTLAAGAFA
ncbi:MAG: hypothetical protein WBI63_04295 [Coriobacteriia bacterium]